MAALGNNVKMAFLKGLEALGKGASNMATNAHQKLNEINLEDVYKRQVSAQGLGFGDFTYDGGAAFFHLQRSENLGIGHDGETHPRAGHGVEPVSYTHLDVYKRQS